MPVRYHRSTVAEIEPVVLYRLLTLRVAVFVVEQQAAYPDLDGRDDEAGAELLWAQEGDTVLATLRVLQEPGAWRIGRVATAAAARGRGAASELMRRAILRCTERDPALPILLGGQTHLVEWYGRFGFVIDGDGYEEDGIPHAPMRRSAS